MLDDDLEVLDAEALELVTARLTAQKLREEIAEQQRHWWKKPSWVAPLASVVAAVIGLVWAISSGFFETQRRAIALQTELLRAQRDDASAAFQKEKASYQAEIQSLRKQSGGLQAQVSTLDRPILVEARVFAEPGSNVTGTSIPLELRGANFGAAPGVVQTSLGVQCAHATVPWFDPAHALEVRITEWSPTRILLTASKDNLRELMWYMVWESAATIRGATETQCEVLVIASVRRDDGRTTDTREILLPGARAWARKNEE